MEVNRWSLTGDVLLSRNDLRHLRCFHSWKVLREYNKFLYWHRFSAESSSRGCCRYQAAISLFALKFFPQHERRQPQARSCTSVLKSTAVASPTTKRFARLLALLLFDQICSNRRVAESLCAIKTRLLVRLRIGEVLTVKAYDSHGLSFFRWYSLWRG